LLIEADDLEMMGARTREALAGSKVGIPPPATWSRSGPLLKLAGVRTHKAFEKAARRIGIVQSGENFEIRPYKYLSQRDGYGLLEHKTLRAGNLNNEELGCLILRGFELYER
jgi:hypothetical protein